MEKSYANPAPLGLLGFGMTTTLLSLHNAGFFPVASVVWAMAIAYGGISQVIAGILEFRKGNTFGMTAFCSYGFFWISLVGIWYLPQTGYVEASSVAYVGWYLFLWGLFSFFMWMGTFGKPRMLQVIFFVLFVVFFLLAIRDWTGIAAVGTLAGYLGIILGFMAIYLGVAEVLKESQGKTILPFGERH